MSKQAIAVGGAVLSLAALSFSLRPESAAGAAREAKSPEPAVAPELAGSSSPRPDVTCALPGPEKTTPEVTCALPASPADGRTVTAATDEPTIFHAPVVIESKIIAAALNDIRTFKSTSAEAAARIGQQLSELPPAELQRESTAAAAGFEAEARLARGVPSRDTAFLGGLKEALEILTLHHGTQPGFSPDQIRAIVPAVTVLAMNRAGFGPEATAHEQQIAHAARLSRGSPDTYEEMKTLFNDKG